MKYTINLQGKGAETKYHTAEAANLMRKVTVSKLGGEGANQWWRSCPGLQILSGNNHFGRKGQNI